MARLVDLKVGEPDTLDPAAYLERVKQANLARIKADAELEPTAAGPAVAPH